jgi:hypothetical protein
MSEMVERVAQSICGDGNPENILEIHRIRARLAIEAMREPTEAMIEAGWIATGDKPQTHWEAMICEALK